MTKLVVCIAFALGCLFIYACNNNKDRVGNTSNATTNGNATAQSKTASATPANDELATGRDLYNKNCANCHREDGTGGPTVVDGKKLKPADLTNDRHKRLSDDKIIESMVKGIDDEGMPSFKDKLSEAEMREVVRYVRVGLQKQEPVPSGATTTAADSNASSHNK